MAMDPFFAVAHYELGQAFVQKHMYNEAIAELQKAIELSAGSTTFRSNLAYAYAVSGKRNEAVKILNDLKNQVESRLFKCSRDCLGLCRSGRQGSGNGLAGERPMRSALTLRSSCGQLSTLCGPTRGSRTYCAALASVDKPAI